MIEQFIELLQSGQEIQFEGVRCRAINAMEIDALINAYRLMPKETNAEADWRQQYHGKFRDESGAIPSPLTNSDWWDGEKKLDQLSEQERKRNPKMGPPNPPRAKWQECG